MNITITINTDNFAFSEDEGGAEYEVSEILSSLAWSITVYGLDATDGLSCRDHNGNTVGKVAIGE